MIKTHLELFDGVVLSVPDNFVWPHLEFAGFPPCCGAGLGWGEKVVPETILGQSFSPACCLHDECYRLGKTWADFRQSNMLFLQNMLSINRASTSRTWLKNVRISIIYARYIAVSTPIGAFNFFKRGN